MKSLKKIALAWGVALVLPGLVHGQALSAVETAEIGVEALLQSVAESKHLLKLERLYMSLNLIDKPIRKLIRGSELASRLKTLVMD